MSFRSTTRRVVASLAATVALGAAALTGPVAAAPAAASASASAKPARVSKAGTVPCPRPDVKPPPGRPPRPTPPQDDPVLRAVGGDALATDGLVVPQGARKPPALTATSWLVADLDTGEVLGGCGPHVYGTPASVQKMLLAATVMDRLDPKKTITVTDGDLAIEPGSSAVGLLKGGKYTIATLWLGLLLNSGNEAANALARLGGGAGGVPATVAAMNAEAKRLGAYQTHAVTPSGLDGPGQFTSAYDLALIARKCFANADFRRYALTRATQIPAQKQLKKGGFQIQNENKLIFNYPGALGGKTGFTKLARHSYVGAAQRGDRRLVATLLGAEASPLRGWQQGAALLDWGFSLPRDASVGKLVEPDGKDAKGTAADTEAAPAGPAAGSTHRAAPTAARTAATPGLSLGAAAAIAVILAGTPLLLLLTQRRRHRVRRRPRGRPQAS
ncbi:serine hydrolase [Couchioplanes caeruleus]|uniref:D-alanyl-D-alanine carboxypeptidase family protein n=1 Tax=Couchioplanes caeruleus TaxID=56438 RepID=UPI0020BD70EA|nr:serine hydrolase [Couchioplanes caeruleus]UQU67004.1 serine hydrolase [Couchioplanes caeruleus]